MLLYNLAFLPARGAGLATYARNLLAHLPVTPLTVLSASPPEANHRHYPIDAHLSDDFRGPGLRRRLWWLQTQLPGIYKQLGAKLHFSPVPEGPLVGGCRTVVTVHDLIPLHFRGQFPPLLEIYFRYFVPAVLRRAEHVICDSQATAADVMRFCGLAARKLSVVPLAYDAGHFYPRGLACDDYFLYLGRADRHKNLARLIAAFARLQGQCALRLVGTGRPAALAAQVTELGVANRVQFVDYVPYAELPGLIERAIALVLPSLYEGFGLPALEAMACGTPVIAANRASLPEVVGDAALLVDPLKVQEITAAMAAVMGDGSLRAQLSAAGLVRARQFSWPRTGRLTGEILSRYV